MLYTDLLTYCMEQSPSWEATRFSASQEISRILWNPKVYYLIQRASQVRDFCKHFVTGYAEEFLAPRPTPKLEDHLLSVIRYWLFNIFAATLFIEGRSSIRNLRTRHAVVTETHLSRKEP
jgi:hypothetical protein